jgi:hypothetical protein
MILTYRLVRLIETHSDALAASLLQKVQKSDQTDAYCKVPLEELKERVRDIYLHLGEWLLGKSDADIERRYTLIGVRRAQQGVPLCQLIWAIVLTKNNLWEFILDESAPDRPVEIFGKQELLQLLNHFFDCAIHAAAIGYEWAADENAKTQHAVNKAG